MEDWINVALLPRDARLRKISEIFDEVGLPEARRVAKEYAELIELPIFAIAASRVTRHLARAGSPARAAIALGESIRSLEERRGDASPLFVEPILGIFIELAGSSARAARSMSTDPALAIEIGTSIDLERNMETRDYAAVLSRIVTSARGETVRFDRLLRRWRNREMLRIALRELRNTDVRRTAAELADLASAALQAALEHHRPMVEADVGRPDPPCRHVIVGMGKLGGRELNFSSDIDLIYLYEHDDGRAGEATIHEHFVDLFRRVTGSISQITEHGFVFRVDLDLRPEGRPGPLANSLASAERYYETWGRTWERAAWIKARPVAGDLDLGPRIADFIRPFVYRRAFDLKAIEAIVEMKSKIDAQRKRSGLGPRVDLKLGKGGIREIEFFVQAYQLLHGGHDRRMRIPNTLDALQALEAAGLVNARTRATLADAYLLLRKVEHRVQIVDEQQTHTLPVDPEALAQLARSLGYPSPEVLLRHLQDEMGEAHELFKNLLGAAEEEWDIPPEADRLLDEELSEEARLATLAELGSRSPYESLSSLRSAARMPGSPFHPRADDRQRMLARAFLAECLSSPDLDRALEHLPRLMHVLVLHKSYLERFERPPIRRGVARVLGASDLLARILISNPSLLSEVLLPDSLPTQPTLQLDTTEKDPEEVLAVLRAAKQEELLRTALADLGGVLATDAVEDRLTRLAEILIDAALELAQLDTEQRYGRPKDPAAQLAVIGGGTLGARELGYRSDVDLSFIYDGEGETEGGSRGPIDVGELYTRVAQRLISFLALRGREGALYSVDMRLRPSGSQGVLVASMRNFEAYHQKDAQLWERQALIRSRTIAGSLELRTRVDAAIHAAAYGRGPAREAAPRIHEMRVRLGQERAMRKLHRGAPALDLKLGRGGLIEVEFLVQYLLIQHGSAHPEIRTTSTRTALRSLAQAGLLEPDRAKLLAESYDRLRRVLNWLRIAHDEPLDQVDLSEGALRTLALAVGYQGRAAATLLARDLQADTELIHRTYREVLRADD
jgi:[glutamine synthetase] adenylyltransferase / [glutamine synthetase]-adenylyl-L-tyrosine phosphorylase